MLKCYKKTPLFKTSYFFFLTFVKNLFHLSGIYIHIPFCRKKCNYCNFHFSTRLDFKDAFLQSLFKEFELRKNSSPKQKISTVYFGGGTPSILSVSEIASIFETLNSSFDLSDVNEITLEANPDDLTFSYLSDLKNHTPINRFSIGIQSFFQEDLIFMNRAHNALQAEKAVIEAQKIGFKNLSIDLIYGGQTTSDEKWISNINKALELEIPHISAYALTIEPKTALESKIRKNKIDPIDEEKQFRQFQILRKKLKENRFIQYEFSNFGKEGFFSKHNSSYWNYSSYLGFGPSAHSFNGKNIRSWNVSNNIHYIKKLQNNILPSEEEIITEKDVFNEKIMLGLRTAEGIDIQKLKKDFSATIISNFNLELKKLLKKNKVEIYQNKLRVREEYIFQTDGIISQLFYID